MAVVELRPGGHGISCRSKGNGDGNARGKDSGQLQLQRGGQDLRNEGALTVKNAVIGADDQPAVDVDAELGVEAALSEIQLGRVHVGKSGKAGVARDIFLLRKRGAG